MTSGDDPRERADGWFDIRETTTVDGLQRRLDGIGMLLPCPTAGDTGLSGLMRQTLLAINATGMPPDVFDDGNHHQCDWGVQWCDQPAYGWIDAWLPSQGDREHPGRMHLCRRHYAFQLEENINAILHDPEYAAAQTDEQRRLVVFRYIIAFGRE